MKRMLQTSHIYLYRESVDFRSFNTEWMPTASYRSSNEARVTTTEYIKRYYNQVRPHQYSGGLTPNESKRRFNNEYKSVANFT